MGIFGGSGEVSGYNVEEVNALRDVINGVAQKAGEGICEKLGGGVVVPMSTVWYAPEAITFFEGFKDAVKKSGETVTAAFDAFRDAVQKAGENWAENTGGEKPSLAAIDPVELDLDISSIQEKGPKGVTIDEGEASKVANNLANVENEIEAALKSITAGLSADTAFLGHGQAEAVEQCFNDVAAAIKDIFKYLTDGEGSLQGQINAAVKKYGEVASGISSAFSSSTKA
ncbi:MAG: hypothetical protein VZS44_00190 [Bacilli bacterium]|nr:hypothetical protein [Bacilli bacterium]